MNTSSKQVQHDSSASSSRRLRASTIAHAEQMNTRKAKPIPKKKTKTQAVTHKGRPAVQKNKKTFRRMSRNVSLKLRYRDSEHREGASVASSFSTTSEQTIPESIEVISTSTSCPQPPPPRHPTSLFNLPHELLLSICDHLTPTDIHSLVCCHSLLASHLQMHLRRQAPKYRRKKDNSGVLHWAAAFGRFELVKYLVEEGVALDETVKDYGTALWFAVLGGHYSIAKYLLDMGANVQGGGDAARPLEAAVLNNHIEVARLLIERGAKIDTFPKRPGSLTALFLAVGRGHVEMSKMLLEEGADPLVYIGDTDRTDRTDRTMFREMMERGGIPNDAQKEAIGLLVAEIEKRQISGAWCPVDLKYTYKAAVSRNENKRTKGLLSAFMVRYYGKEYMFINGLRMYRPPAAAKVRSDFAIAAQ